MSLFAVDNWLRAPTNRDIIARWTKEVGSFELTFPELPDGDHFEFLALGDSGDSDANGPTLSPQEAVAHEMAQDAALPESSGQGCMVLHMGDVVYMTGERRLYDRNFRRPYEAFLMPESTVDNLVFRLPFLPVPGNHDYYDLGAWALWLSKIPILGSGLRAVTHELFAFSVPEGGSDMGRAFMRAFVDLQEDPRPGALEYLPGEKTRAPNRYYRFRRGSVDFFALDSNTLSAPPPGTDAGQVRAAAAEHIQALDVKARELDAQLRRCQRELEARRAESREQAAGKPAVLQSLGGLASAVAAVLSRLQEVLELVEPHSPASEEAAHAVATAARRWSEASTDLEEAREPVSFVRALHGLEEASDESCAALGAMEGCLAVLPESAARTDILAARREVETALEAWSRPIEPPPPELCAQLHQLSEEALDVQRELALERRRLRYRPEDFDTAQFRWLEESLAESLRERPGAWRVLYLHHPLYTTIANHCERPDVVGLRDNLLNLIQGKVHLVLSGHSHAFEWFRSDLLPHTGLFVTGGGGQLSLRRSLLDPRLLHRRRDQYVALREHGAVECAMGGRGPAAADGANGSLYHYLRIQVTPEALRVYPIGVRRLGVNFRREAPMPVYHASQLPEGRPPWKPRRLAVVEIRRDQPPEAVWD